MPKIETPKSRRSRRPKPSSAGPVVLSSIVQDVKAEQAQPEIAVPVTKSPAGAHHNPHPWKHPAELEFIEPEDWDEGQIIGYLYKNGFSIPARDTTPALSMPWVKVNTCEGEVITLPRGYRIPLMFVAKFQWESLRLLKTSSRRKEDWEDCKFDILHVSRLCTKFFEEARSATAAGKMDKTWRCAMFDRVLVRYYRRWLVSRDTFVRDFWLEFDEEEFESDVLKRDWNYFARKGHKGFHLTKAEIQNGISFQEFTGGLGFSCAPLHKNNDADIASTQEVDSHVGVTDDHPPMPVTPTDHSNDAMVVENSTHLLDLSNIPLSSPKTPAEVLASPSLQIKPELREAEHISIDGPPLNTTKMPSTPNPYPSPTTDVDEDNDPTPGNPQTRLESEQEQEHPPNHTAFPDFVIQGQDEDMHCDGASTRIDSDMASGGAPASISSASASPTRDEGDHPSSQPDSPGHRGLDLDKTDTLRAEANNAQLLATEVHEPQITQQSGTVPGLPEDSAVHHAETNDASGSGEDASGPLTTDVVMVDFNSEGVHPPSIPLDKPHIDDEHDSQRNLNAADDQGKMVPTITNFASPHSILTRKSPTIRPPAERRLKEGNSRMTRTPMSGVRPKNTIPSLPVSSSARKPLTDKSPATPKQNSWEARVRAALERARNVNKPTRISADKNLDTARKNAPHLQSPNASNGVDTRTDTDSMPGSECPVSTEVVKIDATQRVDGGDGNHAAPPQGTVLVRNQPAAVEILKTSSSDASPDVNVAPQVLDAGCTVSNGSIVENRMLRPFQGSLEDQSARDVEMDVDADSTSVQHSASGAPPDTSSESRDISINSRDDPAPGCSQAPASGHQIVNHTPVVKKLVSTLRGSLAGLTDALETIEREDARVSALLSNQLIQPPPPDAPLVTELRNEIQSLKKHIQRDAECRLQQDAHVQRLQDEIDSLRRQVLLLNNQSLKIESPLIPSLQHHRDSVTPRSPHPLSQLLPIGFDLAPSNATPILSPPSSYVGEPPSSSPEHPECLSPLRTPSPRPNPAYDDGTPLPIRSKRKHHMLFDHQQN